MKLTEIDLETINQDFSQMKDPLEPIKVASALNSELLKFDYRKKNKPKDISILDYTVMAALQKQFPAKVKDIEDSTYCECPECGAIAVNEYCSTCGQRLFYEEELEVEDEDQE